MIQAVLNKEAVEQLFAKEAYFLNGSDVIPEYRVVELFGTAAAVYIEANTGTKGYLVGGRDYNGTGACSVERPFIRYFYKAGFEKIATNHNYLLTVEAHKTSEGGKIADAVWAERSRRLDAEDKASEKKARKSRQQEE